MITEKRIFGFFGQELNEGDVIAFVATSGNSYMRICKIVSIEFIPKITRRWLYPNKGKPYLGDPENYFEVIIKVQVRDCNAKKWHYDPKTNKGYHETYDHVYTKRIYNFQSAITLIDKNGNSSNWNEQLKDYIVE